MFVLFSRDFQLGRYRNAVAARHEAFRAARERWDRLKIVDEKTGDVFFWRGRGEWEQGPAAQNSQKFCPSGPGGTGRDFGPG